MKTPLSGAFPVLPTPFRPDGAIDEQDFKSIIRFALDSGVDGVVYPGVASEVDTLSKDERRRQVDLLAAEIGNRIPIILGASDPDPAVAARHVAHAAEIGAAAAMVMAPGHLGNSIEAQTEYFRQVAADAGVPIMLQNQPKPIGAGLTPEEVAAVASSVEMIRYIKEETPPCGQHLTRIKNAANGSVDAIFGGAGGRYVMDEMARGAAGTMPACELADIHAMMMNAWHKGDVTTARRLYSASLPLLNFQAIFRMHMTKEVLRRRGVIQNTFVRGKGPKFDEGDRTELALLLQEAELPYKHHRPV
jgi:4-hydroxy-tetrahydrodipicolinate synthase